MVAKSKSQKMQRVGLVAGGAAGGIATLGYLGKRKLNKRRTLRYMKNHVHRTQEFYQKNPKQYHNDLKVAKQMAKEKGPLQNEAIELQAHLEKINKGIKVRTLTEAEKAEKLQDIADDRMRTKNSDMTEAVKLKKYRELDAEEAHIKANKTRTVTNSKTNYIKEPENEGGIFKKIKNFFKSDGKEKSLASAFEPAAEGLEHSKL